MADPDEPFLRKTVSIHRYGISASAPVLPTSPPGTRPSTSQVCTGRSVFDDSAEQTNRLFLPTPSSTTRSRPATSCFSSTSTPSACHPGSGRFSPEEMACFKGRATPSRGCPGKAEVYWQTQGAMKKSLSEGANCWHTLPVLKGKFYCQDRLDSADITEARPVKKQDLGLVALPDEAMTAIVLDEIYPKTPKTADGSPGRRQSMWDVSPMKDQKYGFLQIPDASARKKDRNRSKRNSAMTDWSKDAGGKASSSSGRFDSNSSFGASRQTLMGTSGTLGGLTKMEPTSPISAEGLRGTKSLAPLVYFRSRLEEKYTGVKEGLEFWANEFPSSRIITKKEFQRILRTRMMVDIPNDVRENIFNSLDVDGDGVTSLAEFQVSVNAAGPVAGFAHLRRRWLATGFKSMKSALCVMSDSETISSKGLNLPQFGEALSRVHVIDYYEHQNLFNLLADPQDRSGRVSIVQLACALATVSPDMQLEELRERLVRDIKYRGAALPLRRAWSDLELGGGDVRLQDFVGQAMRKFGLADIEAAKVFRAMDVDCSGYIDRADFLSALTLTEPSLFLEDLRTKIRQRFRSINAVFEKAYEFHETIPVVKLSLESIQGFLRQIDLTDNECESLFKLIDVEDSGSVTVQEFLRSTVQFAPSVIFEDLRLQCLQRHQDVQDVFADVDAEQLGHMDFSTFVGLLTDMKLADGLNLRAVFDTLDIQSKGFVTLHGMVALLQAGGPGAGVKLEEEGLRIRAKQDIRGYTAPVHRLVGDLKTEARQGEHTISLATEMSRNTLAGKQDLSREAPEEGHSRPTTREAASRSRAVAPRLKVVVNQTPDGDLLHQSTLNGPNSFGPHSRAGDFKKLTEKTLSNPQSSWNTIWKHIQMAPALDKKDRGAIEKEVQGYYQEVYSSLSGDVPLLEQPQSKHALHQRMNTHRVMLEPDSKRRILQKGDPGTAAG